MSNWNLSISKETVKIMLQVYTNCSEAIPFNLFSLKLFGALLL